MGFWNEARPQRPTISSARMVAGISGATPGSASGAETDDNDGRLMLLHAPRNIVSAEAIARLATVRALRDLIIGIPLEQIRGRSRPSQPSAKRLPEQ